MRLRLILAALTLVAGVVAASRADAKPKIAVLGIEPVDDGAGETANLARSLTEGLRARAQQARSRFDIAPNANKELTELKLLADCIDEARDCMTSIGRDLGADRLIFGRIERKGSSYAITIRFLNIQTGKWEGKGKFETTIGQDQAHDAGMKKVASMAWSELTGTPTTGTIVIRSNVATGTLYLDGIIKVAIANRTATLGDLPEGRYNVAIEAQGYQRWETTTEVQAGETTRVDARLEPETSGGGLPGGGSGGGDRPGGTSRALFWTTLVVTAGGVASFTITGLKVREYEDQKVDAILNSGGQIESDSSEDACREARAEGYRPLVEVCDKGEDMAMVTNVLIGVTAFMAVASGYFYYKGYVSPGKRSERRGADQARTRRKKRPATEIVVTPEVYPGGGGVGAVISF